MTGIPEPKIFLTKKRKKGKKKELITRENGINRWILR